MTSRRGSVEARRAGLPGARSRWTLWVLLVLGSGLGSAAPAAGQAPTAFLQPKQLSDPVAYHADVAMGPTGDAVAVWTRQSGNQEFVQAATRPAGGDWTEEPEDISGIGPNGSEPQVAVAPDGDAVAAWLSEPGAPWGSGLGTAVVQAASYDADGGSCPGGTPCWSAPRDLSSAPTLRIVPGPGVAVDGHGNAVVVWINGRDGGDVEAASRSAAGNWGTKEKIGEGSFTAPQVAVDPEGNAVAVWRGVDGSSVVQAATRPAGGDWSAAENVSAGTEFAFEPRLAMDAAGTAVVIWARDDPEGTKTVQAAIRPGGDNWSAAGWSTAELSPASASVHGWAVGVEDGRAVALWAQANEDGEVVVESKTRPAGGGWSADAQQVAPAGSESDSYRTQVAVVDGDAIAMWYRCPQCEDPESPQDETEVIQAAIRPEGGAWSLQDLGTSERNVFEPQIPQIAVDGQGNAAAIWPATRPGSLLPADFVIHAAGYDAAGPQLRELAVPGAGPVASGLAFSVSPRDVWSRVASTNWSFGDGASASGSSVSHAFAAPGSYEVTVTSTDSLGNSSTEKRTVVISAAEGGSSGGSGSAMSPAGDGVLGEPGRDGESVASDARRLRALRGCLGQARRHTTRERRRSRSGSLPARSRARRHMRRHGARLRRRCIARYGRTPGRVRRLGARAGSRGEIVLSFRAAGTHRDRPPAARTYLVKQSTRPIRGRRGFRRARALCNGSCRFEVSEVGAKITLTITGLQPNTTYYYVVAARDNASRRLGPRSRPVSARTR